MQLNPSTKRDTRGFAVEVKRSCCVVGGPWTWSKEKTCFLAAAPDAGEAAPEAPCPAEELVDASIETDVEETA